MPSSFQFQIKRMFTFASFIHVILIVHHKAILHKIVLIPNRTILVHFGGIPGEFGRAMVCILVRRSRAKISMVKPNKPDILPECTKMVRLGIHRTQISKFLVIQQDFRRVNMSVVSYRS